MTSSIQETIPVIVAGALGKMGREVVKAVSQSSDCELLAAIDNSPDQQGIDVGVALGLNEQKIFITSDLEGSLCSASQAVRDNGEGNPAPGLTPRLISGCPNFAELDAIIKSHIIASSHPPPKA